MEARMKIRELMSKDVVTIEAPAPHRG